MIILPAIDLYAGKAVRLYKGDYAQMTVYKNDPLDAAKDFENSQAEYIHIVDLEGAKNGGTPNIKAVERIIKNTSLNAEIGGGIRSVQTIEEYISIGIKRVILGTAAITDERFLKSALDKYGDVIAVGVDIRDGLAAIKGWTETSNCGYMDFCSKIQDLGVKTIICTDISRDGAMKGVNIPLYKNLSENFSMRIIASGGVSNIEDIKTLRSLNLYGAIIGKAYYSGAINIREAIEAAR